MVFPSMESTPQDWDHVSHDSRELRLYTTENLDGKTRKERKKPQTESFKRKRNSRQTENDTDLKQKLLRCSNLEERRALKHSIRQRHRRSKLRAGFSALQEQLPNLAKDADDVAILQEAARKLQEYRVKEETTGKKRGRKKEFMPKDTPTLEKNSDNPDSDVCDLTK
mmetsp:Transcript_10318/g.18584  ORF Transcript_10318/g.18584 Transcript_10318/m.18584 type:complete len:167 (-) Transcript_10318:1846-2346(-)